MAGILSIKFLRRACSNTTCCASKPFLQRLILGESSLYTGCRSSRSTNLGIESLEEYKAKGGRSIFFKTQPSTSYGRLESSALNGQYAYSAGFMHRGKGEANPPPSPLAALSEVSLKACSLCFIINLGLSLRKNDSEKLNSGN